MKLEESNRHRLCHHLLEDTSFPALIGMDEGRRVVLWSAGARALFGYQEEEILGQLGDLLFVEEDRAAGVPDDEVTRAIAHGSAPNVRWHLRADGSRFWGVGKLVYLGPDGEAGGPGRLHYVKLLTDRTDHRRVEELRESEVQAAYRFAATAAHDLRGPLRTVRATLQLVLRDETGLGQQSRSMLQQTTESVKLLSDLVESLTLWSRPEQERLHRRERVDLGAIIDQVVITLAEDIRRAEATVTHSPLPIVLADGTQVRQLLQNLVANAIEHGGKAPRVHLRAEARGERWRIAVCDRGPGVPSADQERIFAPLERSGRGSGMGLAICRRIVEAHGGRIQVEETPGGGATFVFDLPSADR